MTLPEAFRPIYIISGIWQGAGWASIMYTASLSNASKDLKEAAMIDGANLIQQIMTVEWPAIKDMVVIQFILQFFSRPMSGRSVLKKPMPCKLT